MKRTTIFLPEELRVRAKQCAEHRGVSLADLLRQALEREIAVKPAPDPLFVPLKGYVRRKGVPHDLAANHDEYLYGGK